jgi:hypothetical protein
MFRKRNRIFKRLVLGFAVAALVVPSAAIAAVDEGGAGQQGTSVKAHDYFAHHALPSNYAASAVSIENVRLNPRGSSSTVSIEDVRLNPRGSSSTVSIEDVRLNPRGSTSTVTGDIENVRLNPRTVSAPEVVSAGFDWGDAGIGAGISLGLVLVGGAALYATRQAGKAQTA